jgi:peptide-methionine (S)-S-oxide reductase
MEKATFAAGCFWGVEDEFRKVPGVLNATVGYSGGRTQNPTYKDVCSGTTGHAEVCQVEFDPEKTSFESLVSLFFNMHDPTTLNRQGPDVGSQYRSAIFYHNETQRTKAEEVKEKLEKEAKFKRPIVTEVKAVSDFYPAEEYHQQYFQKNGISHCHI